MTGLPAPETDWVTTYLHKYRPSAHPMVNVQTPHGAGDQPQLASRNNNPGNLNYAHQPNAVAGDSGFAKFKSPEEGFHALISQIQLDQSRGLPLGAFIAKYAPPTENDTARYVQQVSTMLGVNPGTPINTISPVELAKVIARRESGSTVTPIEARTPWQPPTPPAAQGPLHPGGGANF